MFKNLKNNQFRLSRRHRNRKWRNTSPFSFSFKINNIQHEIIFPEDLIFPELPFPRVFSIFLPLDKKQFLPASCLYEALRVEYKDKFDKQDRDIIFWEALLDLGIPRWRAEATYRLMQTYRLFEEGPRFYADYL